MGKNMYSLILSDELVEAVDKLAYEKSTSRSNLINHILAEYFSFTTPEMRIKSTLGFVEAGMRDCAGFQILLQPSGSVLTLKSAVRFRYNPSIRYSLEIYRKHDTATARGKKIGELRVSMRTQSQELLRILTSFFIIWQAIEDKYTAGAKSFSRVAEGRYERSFFTAESKFDEEKTASVITEYIKLFDDCLKLYFARQTSPERVVAEIENNYKNYIRKGVGI